MTKDTRISFDKDFYALQAVLNSNKFGRLFAKFRQEMKSKGLPFPQKGFKTVKEYHEWRTKVHAKDIYYEGFIENVVKEFGLKKEAKEKYRIGLQWYVYFGRKEAPIKFTHAKLISTSNDKKSVEVVFTIYPWTVKDDIIGGLWERIEVEQQKLVGYRGQKRNREWKTFERDLKIYELFLRIKKENPKSVYRRLVEHPEFGQIVKTYKAGESIDDAVGTIITRCKRAFGEINLL